MTVKELRKILRKFNSKMNVVVIDEADRLYHIGHPEIATTIEPHPENVLVIVPE